MRALVLVCCSLVLSITVARANEGTDQQLQDRLRAHIEFLADDLMSFWLMT